METRKGFFRRLSEKTRIHTIKQTVIMPQTTGLEEEVVRENITTIGEQVDVFRSAYARVPPLPPLPTPSPHNGIRQVLKSST
jgi:hypothetical protein